MKDLYLKYKFTDRRGQPVYDIYQMPDDMSLMMPVEDIQGELRMDGLPQDELVMVPDGPAKVITGTRDD